MYVCLLCLASNTICCYKEIVCKMTSAIPFLPSRLIISLFVWLLIFSNSPLCILSSLLCLRHVEFIFFFKVDFPDFLLSLFSYFYHLLM